MKRILPGCAALFLALLLPVIAAAQNGASTSGQVFDRDGKPWEGVTVEVKSEAGRIFTLKTDKDGKFIQVGLAVGPYTFTLTKPPELPSPGYSERHFLSTDTENLVSFNFKEIIGHAGPSGPSAQEVKKRDDQANAFKNMKANFQAGVDAMTDVAEQRKQLNAASADQKAAIKDKMSADYQTAITSFQEAEKGVDAKDVGNHAVVWANLGQAYDGAGKYDDASAAYQKAVELKPAPEYYANLGTALANAGASQTDPAVLQERVTASLASCDKAAALDPTNPATGAHCWKNVGIVLSNKGDFKDAVPALQKATQSDAKDIQAWYLLGGAYTGMIDSKQTGDKIIYIIPPGTAEAYQKVIDIDPNGPYAAQAKTMLDSLAAMGGGVSTTVGEKRAKKK
jgi:tetratricopeptide (TPR) repeat protein